MSRNNSQGPFSTGPGSADYESEPVDREDLPATRSHRSLTAKLHFFLQHLWIVGLCFVAGLFAAIGYVLKAVPIYQSTAVLQVPQQEERGYDSKSDDHSDSLVGDDIVNTIAQSFKLDSLYERVAMDPTIQQDPHIVPPASSDQDRPSLDDLANQLKSATSVSLRPRTRLIDITAESPVPEVAQKIVTVVINQYIAATAENDVSTSSAKEKFLLEEVGRTKLSLQKAEEGLEIYKEALRQKQRVDDQQKVVDDLSERYLDAHPKLIEARSLLQDLRLAFDSEIKKVIASSPTEADYWAQNQKPLADAKEDLVASELKFVEARTNVLQREVDTESSLFDSLSSQMRDEDVKTASAAIEIKVVDPAHLPRYPVRPERGKVILEGMIGGLVLGAAIVLLLMRLDSTFSSPEEVVQYTKLPILASIPAIPKPRSLNFFRREPEDSGESSKGTKDQQHLVLVSDPDGITAEGIRNFRAGLDLVGREQDHRCTLITSALPGEGKTFMSCNYAVSLAQQGIKTLLIDADLRRPRLHGALSLKNNRPGLTERIAKGLDLSATVHRNVFENLDVMLSGGRCPNPAELFSGTAFKETLDAALLAYDRVVVDSPPINVVSDTRMIAPYVQNICLVVKADSTPRQAVLRALDFLRVSHALPVGIIFNCVSKWSIDDYYGYKYSDSYKYGEAYSQKS